MIQFILLIVGLGGIVVGHLVTRHPTCSAEELLAYDQEAQAYFCAHESIARELNDE